MSEQGVLREAADLTRAAMTEDPYARGVCGSLVDGLWGLPMNFIGNPQMISDLVDSPSGAGQWRAMFPQPEARRLMTWGINLGVGIGQMRRRWHEPGEEIVTVDEAEDGSYRVRRPLRPVGAHDTRVLRTWDPKYLRNQWWDNTWWLMTADGEIRIEPNDGEWLLYLPYGEIKPWEYGAWKALTLAFVLGRDALFDRSRHAEVLAPVRVGKVPQGTTERQRRRYLEQIRAMQRMHAFVLPPGLEYSIVESTGKINDLYSQIIEWQERAYCLIYTGNETTIKGTTGFSAGDVQERVAKAVLQSLSGSLADCLRGGGLIEWGVANYGTPDVPLARFDCDPPEDKLAKAKTVSEAGGALAAMSTALKGEGMRLTRECVTAYVQSFGLVAEELPTTTVASVKLDIAPTDVAKVFTANEIRASQGAGPMVGPRGLLTIPELDAAASGPTDGATPAPGLPGAVALPQADAAVAATDDDEPLTDEDAAALAALMTEHAVPRCEHKRPNRCPQCRIERVRKLIIDENGGEHGWGIAWKAIGTTAAQPAEVES